MGVLMVCPLAGCWTDEYAAIVNERGEQAEGDVTEIQVSARDRALPASTTGG